MLINTRRVKNRRRLRFETVDAVFAEADALAMAERAGKLVARGNWSLGQSINHLAVWAEFAFTGTPVPTPWLVRFIMKFLKKRVLNHGMIAGVKIRGIEGGTLGADLTATDVAIARLRTALDHLTRETPPKPNVLFGPLTHDEWIKLQLRHAELHLGFYEIA